MMKTPAPNFAAAWAAGLSGQALARELRIIADVIDEGTAPLKDDGDVVREAAKRLAADK